MEYELRQAGEDLQVQSCEGNLWSGPSAVESCAEAKVATECCSLLERLSVVELVNIEASERVVFVARLEESRGGVRWRGY